MMSMVNLRLGFSCLLISCILLALHGPGSFWSGQATPSEGRRLREHIDDKGIPLTFGYAPGASLLVEVQPQRRGGGWLPKQRLILDTGSSTLAFCDRQLKVSAQYEASNLLSCNKYGTAPFNYCGYWGPFVQGDIQVGNQTWKNSSYSIMEQETNMSCSVVDGIFGIAFAQIDRAFSAESQAEIVISEDSVSCPNSSHFAGNVPPPLMHHLLTERSQKIGILWGIGEPENASSYDEGRLYLGQPAVDNEHYAEHQQYAVAAKLVEEGWYNIDIQSISVGNETFALTCNPLAGLKCVMDTGTPGIVLPPAVYEATIEQNGTMVMELAASNGSVEITLDIGVLQALWGPGCLLAGSEDDPLILGLPLWIYYYTVFDIKAKEVVFLPKWPPSSNGRRLLRPPPLLI